MGRISCSKCGGPLIAEATGTYGDPYHLRQDGKLGHYIRRIHYEHDGLDSVMVYCSQCGEPHEFKFVDGQRIVLKE